MRPTVHGLDLDGQTRCRHWRSPTDVVALRFPCCGRWYACRDCHDACEDHPGALWPASSREERAVMCGACGAQLTIAEYLNCGDRCPCCGAAFNPGCRKHRHLYYEGFAPPAGG